MSTERPTCRRLFLLKPTRSMASPAECGLIPPSSGRPKGCLAAFGPPRMSNGYVILDNSFFVHAFIPLLLVAAGNRRRGIGTQLIVEAENRCRREKLFTSANETNVAAQTLFEQRGSLCGVDGSRTWMIRTTSWSSANGCGTPDRTVRRVPCQRRSAVL
jgi:hypothetical protein